MRGPSAQATEAVLDRVAESVAGGADATELGEELVATSRVLDSQPVLRRVLTDPSVEGDRKVELVEGLLHDLDDTTLAVVSHACRQRWSGSKDIVDALEQGGVTAFLVAAETAGELDEVEDELFRFARIVEAEPRLREALGDRTAPAVARQQLVDNLLADRAGDSTVALARTAVAGRHRSVTAALAGMQRMAAARRDRLVAVVRVAQPLDESLRERLSGALAQMFEHDLQLNVIVDPEVMGGARVTVGDYVIDGTVSTRLADAHRRLAG